MSKYIRSCIRQAKKYMAEESYDDACVHIALAFEHDKENPWPVAEMVLIKYRQMDYFGVIDYFNRLKKLKEDVSARIYYCAIKSCLYIGAFEYASFLIDEVRRAFGETPELRYHDFLLNFFMGGGSRSLVAEAAGYRVTYYRSLSSKGVFVTFGGSNSNKQSEPFALKFAIELGFDVIYFAQREGTQYQELSRDDFDSIVKNVCCGRDVIFYGSSLGGYCALYYSVGFSSCRVIAASPRNSAHPSISNSSFDGLKFKHDADFLFSPSNTEPVILYDPHVRVDKNYLFDKILPFFPMATVYRTPGSGHNTLSYLRDQGVLKEFVVSAIFSPGGFEKVEKEPRSSFMLGGS